MAMKGDSQTVRDIAKEISETIKDLEQMSEGINNGLQATDKWDDEKAADFNLAMRKVASKVKSPIDDLKKALPKLEKLAQLMDAYTSKKLNE